MPRKTVTVPAELKAIFEGYKGKKVRSGKNPKQAKADFIAWARKKYDGYAKGKRDDFFLSRWNALCLVDQEYLRSLEKGKSGKANGKATKGGQGKGSGTSQAKGKAAKKRRREVFFI
ncbi:hypothetical protein ABW19_dt0208854 [Dactylella cylindrospora]|nr:hypothetical protein ABW19_dt0208854 [Dactylella cylindrospora]